MQLCVDLQDYSGPCRLSVKGGDFLGDAFCDVGITQDMIDTGYGKIPGLKDINVWIMEFDFTRIWAMGLELTVTLGNGVCLDGQIANSDGHFIVKGSPRKIE